MNLWNFLFGSKAKSGPGRKSSIVDVKARILAGIRRTRGHHWIWQRACWESGYGTISAKCLAQRGEPSLMAVHRAAYMVWNGPVSPKEYVFQTCKIRKCCNPSHLIKSSNKADSPRYDRS